MRWFALMLVVMMVFAVPPEAGRSAIPDTTTTPTGWSWSGNITVRIEYFWCDPDLDPLLAGDPDPYFIVSVNDVEVKSPVWDGSSEFDADWEATFSITTRDEAVWIQIAAFDDDTGLTFRDDIIDIDPGNGFTLDLIYDLRTKAWSGDVDGVLAAGDRTSDWGIIAFDIRSTPDDESTPEIAVNVPYAGYGFLNNASLVDSSTGTLYDTFPDGGDVYAFSVNAGDIITVEVQPSRGADFALRLYDPGGGIAATSSNPGNGSVESITYTATVSGIWKVEVYRVSGYGIYSIGINTPHTAFLDARNLTVSSQGAYLLNRGETSVNFRIYDFNVNVTVANPTAEDGWVYLHFFNQDPDYVVAEGFEDTSNVSRGTYSLTLLVYLRPGENRTAYIHPWYMPEGDFWFFALGDNRPGSGVYDAPTDPSPEYRIFMYYYTSVIRPPVGLNDGDLVAGFGGGLLAPDYGDVVNEVMYRKFYFTTGNRDVFFAPAIGNHDVTRDDTLPRNHGEDIYSEYLGPLYYSFNYSNTLFLALDSYEDEDSWWYSGTDQTYGGYIYGSQYLFMKSVLENTTRPNRIVLMHHPVVGPPDRDNTINDEFKDPQNAVDVMRVFVDNNLSFMVVGHLHNYTFYNTTLVYNESSGQWEAGASFTDPGIPTLLTGGGGAHNDYEWIVPDIEGSYHFAMVHVNGTNISYRIYKYENLVDATGTPLTSVDYLYSNDGTRENNTALISNGANYTFPYIRLKFKMSPAYGSYVAYSNTTGTYERVYCRRFADYTVVYVETSVEAIQRKYVHVYPLQVNGAFDSPQTATAFAGDNVTFAHVFTYTGNGPVTVEFTVSTDSGWPAVLQDEGGMPLDSRYMYPGDTVTVYTTVSVPPDATPRTENVTVRALYASTDISSVADRVTVVEPIPEIYMAGALPLILTLLYLLRKVKAGHGPRHREQ